MSDIAIQVDSVSKRYELGTIGTGSLKQDLHQWWNRKVLKRTDLFYNELNLADQVSKQPFIWALNEVSFEAKQGEVWGIVGGNGSGKSTLLKIISRIIRPTHGVVRGKGRLSSLLEVGAGFHEDLTGRENIYLSGYILGMKRHEIKQRFDEIIDFSEISQFIDTPVKRYSSGMYVRLAFAVAAHLDTDIMIVDEVLAVGDADFQKKCLTKMQHFAQHNGRTILFVSHNVQAVRHLCQHALWLKRGCVVATGSVSSILNQYATQDQFNQLHQSWNQADEAPGNHWIKIKSVTLLPRLTDTNEPIDVRTPLTIRFDCWVLNDGLKLSTGVQLFRGDGECVFSVMSAFTDCDQGVVEGTCDIPGYFLNDGSYYLSLIIYRNTWADYYQYESCIAFEVEDYRDIALNFTGKWWGVIRPNLPVRLVQSVKKEVSPLLNS